MRLGAVIRGYRMHQKIPQTALAKEIGISPISLCRVEKDLHVPESKILLAIAIWLVGKGEK